MSMTQFFDDGDQQVVSQVHPLPIEEQYADYDQYLETDLGSKILTSAAPSGSMEVSWPSGQLAQQTLLVTVTCTNVTGGTVNVDVYLEIGDSASLVSYYRVPTALAAALDETLGLAGKVALPIPANVCGYRMRLYLVAADLESGKTATISAKVFGRS